MQRVPRSNGAVCLAFRRDGHRHKDFDGCFDFNNGDTFERCEEGSAPRG